VYPNVSQDWKQRVLDAIKKAIASGGDPAMLDANASMIRRVIRGMGPDKDVVDPGCGARVAMNISAVHVASFCAALGNAYKNTYDLGKTKLLGDIPKGGEIPTRAVVDDALGNVTNRAANEIYFGALEVHGSGIRFYGDICFILKTDIIDENNTVILQSNSYDLVRPPIATSGSTLNKSALRQNAKQRAGLWGTHMDDMAVLKTFGMREASGRRLTTGQVSDAVLDDEDYLEVLKLGSFGATDLQEARVSAADAAAEGQIGEQLRLGLCPSLAELQWRKHRRAAVKSLQGRGVHTRVITTTGRVRA
jgi:hypothetical protein